MNALIKKSNESVLAKFPRALREKFRTQDELAALFRVSKSHIAHMLGRPEIQKLLVTRPIHNDKQGRPEMQYRIGSR